MSNRFPADDEHLHPYPGNLKHHKVSPAMERTIPEVYRAALATLESLIEDGYDHAKERQRKLLCEMMKDDAKSGLYNEKKRHPLLRDSDLAVGIKTDVNRRMTLSEVRDYYEAARAKDAELIQRLVDGLKHAQKFAEEYGYGPLETVQWDLDAAAAAGFKPTEL